MLKLKHIEKIHQLLARNVAPRIAGKLRKCDVYIGGERKKFVSIFKLKTQLRHFTDEFERIFTSGASMDVERLEEKIRENHVLFESIHPFEDFNGRSGRILYNLLRVKCDLPIHIIHGRAKNEKELHVEQASYYSWFVTEEKEMKMEEEKFDFLKRMFNKE